MAVGLAIGGAVSMAGEVAVGLSGWSLWNELMSFLRCCSRPLRLAPRCFFSLNILSKTPGNKGLEGDLILTLSHRPRYLKLLPLYIPCRRRPAQTLALRTPAPFL